MRVCRARKSAILLVLLGGGCSTTQVEPLPVLPADPPPYVQVPHPSGMDMGDLMAIFAEKDAPDPQSLRGCDADLTTLKKKTQSKIEIQAGLAELVRMDPVKWHWCFYSQIFALDEEVKGLTYLDERQKAVLDRFQVLAPVARAFQAEFNDSRYLRWAVSRYRRLSELVFYRKLELSPEGAMSLPGPLNPFGEYRKPVQPSLGDGVLTKYGIIAVPTPAPSSDAVASEAKEPETIASDASGASGESGAPEGVDSEAAEAESGAANAGPAQAENDALEGPKEPASKEGLAGNPSGDSGASQPVAPGAAQMKAELDAAPEPKIQAEPVAPAEPVAARSAATPVPATVPASADRFPASDGASLPLTSPDAPVDGSGKAP